MVWLVNTFHDGYNEHTNSGDLKLYDESVWSSGDVTVEYDSSFRWESQMWKIDYRLGWNARYIRNRINIHPRADCNNRSQYNHHLGHLLCPNVSLTSLNVRHTCSLFQPLVLQK